MRRQSLVPHCWGWEYCDQNGDAPLLTCCKGQLVGKSFWRLWDQDECLVFLLRPRTTDQTVSCCLVWDSGAVFLPYMAWNVLVVPLWSRSWHRLAMRSVAFSKGDSLSMSCPDWKLNGYGHTANSFTCPMAYRKHGKHALKHVECVSPVVICHTTVVLFYAQNPPD